MFAFIAAFVFGLAFILELLGADTGAVSLLFLGLLCVALHLAFGGRTWGRGGS
jgi:hypothetical protein